MDLEGLVAEARARRPEPLTLRERTVAGAMALAFLLVVVMLPSWIGSGRPASVGVLALLVVLYAVAWRVPFEIGTGIAIPAQLVFVPMLFLAPLPLVPALVPLGHLLARVPDYAMRRSHVDRWLLCLSDSWYTLGPVLVLGLLAPGPPTMSHAPVYLLALAAEIALGLANATIGDRLMYGKPMLETARIASWAFRIDVVLSPIGVVLARPAIGHPAVLLVIVPVFWLLHTFSRERKERYAAALELNQAYRGTVMVLSDVVEAEDNYTAHHCRSVVELAAAVGDALRLPNDDKQELEIAALLHDVGKITIPNDVLNKPSRLTDAEFELMKTHTVEGQALLDRVGGKLARVGQIVRSCHERWDGAGYPDGLAGEAIPLAARIVFCCDAYSAMTTDRPYRSAMSREAAIEELESNAGAQFDARIVTALTRVVRAGEVRSAETYSDAVRAVLASESRPRTIEVSA